MRLSQMHAEPNRAVGWGAVLHAGVEEPMKVQHVFGPESVSSRQKPLRQTPPPAAASRTSALWGLHGADQRRADGGPPLGAPALAVAGMGADTRGGPPRYSHWVAGWLTASPSLTWPDFVLDLILA